MATVEPYETSNCNLAPAIIPTQTNDEDSADHISHTIIQNG